ncbi:MAG: MipA/OmpV family protein [Betaproteobacteria bacterium]|nr:MipA/OmpV family protein [Betaproteobacteria bacterium]
MRSWCFVRSIKPTPRASLQSVFLLFVGMIMALPSLAVETGGPEAEVETKIGEKSAPASPTGPWTGVVGLGPMVFPRYSGGTGRQTWLIPLISASYEDIVNIEPLRATVYLWGSDDRKKGLGFAIEPRLGFTAGDGPRLAGIARRKDSLEGGPTFDWDLGVLALSASLMTDLTQSSQSNSARLYAYRELISHDSLKLGVFGGFDWLNSKTANYFFGVRPSEQSPSRAPFQPGTALNATAGFDGRYRLSEHYSLLFGVQRYRLGTAAARSPIVETRQSALGWLGLGWNL